jgi:hypothetical protein
MFSAYAQQLSLRFLLQADAANRPSARGIVSPWDQQKNGDTCWRVKTTVCLDIF